MDWTLLISALLGSGGFAGIAVAVQNWFGLARASHRVRALVALRGDLEDTDRRNAEAIELAIQVAVFRLAARVTTTTGVGSILLFVLLFASGYALSPMFLSAQADQAGLLRLLTGVAAAGGGYLGTAIGVRRDRSRQVRRWLSGEPFVPKVERS